MRLVGEFNRSVDLSSGVDDEDIMAFPQNDNVTVSGQDDNWPVEVDLILSAMEAAMPRSSGDRRTASRSSYRTRAELMLFSQSPLDPPTVLYTRDVHQRGIGFITRERLPLGYGGMVELSMPDGNRIKTHCTIFRCRQAINGWFEGALHFTISQPM